MALLKTNIICCEDAGVRLPEPSLLVHPPERAIVKERIVKEIVRYVRAGFTLTSPVTLMMYGVAPCMHFDHIKPLRDEVRHWRQRRGEYFV
ncbi:hypothetical protein LguiA_013512 [Lonicera macranthoides]